jgi:hypothetical protein
MKKATFKVNMTIDGASRYIKASDLQDAISRAREWHGMVGVTHVSITRDGALVVWAV